MPKIVRGKKAQPEDIEQNTRDEQDVPETKKPGRGGRKGEAKLKKEVKDVTPRSAAAKDAQTQKSVDNHPSDGVIADSTPVLPSKRNATKVVSYAIDATESEEEKSLKPPKRGRGKKVATSALHEDTAQPNAAPVGVKKGQGRGEKEVALKTNEEQTGAGSESTAKKTKGTTKKTGASDTVLNSTVEKTNSKKGRRHEKHVTVPESSDDENPEDISDESKKQKKVTTSETIGSDGDVPEMPIEKKKRGRRPKKAVTKKENEAELVENGEELKEHDALLSNPNSQEPFQEDEDDSPDSGALKNVEVRETSKTTSRTATPTQTPKRTEKAVANSSETPTVATIEVKKGRGRPKVTPAKDAKTNVDDKANVATASAEKPEISSVSKKNPRAKKAVEKESSAIAKPSAARGDRKRKEIEAADSPVTTKRTMKKK